MTKFNVLTEDKWVSQKLNNGEFDYWLVLELINIDDACGRDNEGQSKYNVSLSCVSPGEAGQKNIDKARQSYYGWEDGTNTLSDLELVEMLHSYGVSARLWQSNGNNARKLLKEAKQQAKQTEFLFGFAMDRAVNRIGTTGWEALRGDITAGLSRTIDSGTTEGQILDKMHNV